MKKGIILLSKLGLFTVLLIWILGFILVGIAVQPGLETIIETTTGIQAQWLYTFFDAWLWLTIIVIAGFVALKGFSFIGKWKRQ